MLFPPFGYIFPPCIQSPEKSLHTSTRRSVICQKILGFWFGGNIRQISYMNFSQVMYCNGVTKISVEENILQKCTHQRNLKIFEIFKKVAQKQLKKFSKIFKNN